MDNKKTPPIRVEVLKDGRLIVWSIKDSRRLYAQHFYGKPLGIPKPKDDFEAPLILDPIEGMYLLENGLITVYSGNETNLINILDLKNMVSETLEDIEEKYLVYTNLKEKGLIVTPGIKYGCDFAVYEKGPGLDHAPYIIKVKKNQDGLTAAEIVEAGRLATSVRKTFIIAVVSTDNIRYLSFRWWRP